MYLIQSAVAGYVNDTSFFENCGDHHGGIINNAPAAAAPCCSLSRCSTTPAAAAFVVDCAGQRSITAGYQQVRFNNC